MNTIENEIKQLLKEFFLDDDKVNKWLDFPNPLLGGVSPNSMIRAGREEKLLNVIKQALLGVHP